MQANAETLVNWVQVCREEDLVSNSGVCALINGQQVALFAIDSESSRQLYAIDNFDPVGQANVLYRGIVGSVGDEPVVASPLYKEHYSLVSGHCLDNDTVSVMTYPVRLEQGNVLVAV